MRRRNARRGQAEAQFDDRRPAAFTMLDEDNLPLPSQNTTPDGSVGDWARDEKDAERELAEFREFFIATRPDLVALQPRPAPPSGLPRRLAAATAYLGRLALIRPEVRLPRLDLSSRAADKGLRLLSAQFERRGLKLPPVWAIVNLIVVVTFLVAFAPQILTATAQAGCSWYTVRAGDTLSDVSARYSVPVRDIAAANRIKDPSQIAVNERLCIPMSALATSLNAFIGVHTQQPQPGAPSKVRAFIAFTLPYARRASAETGWPVSVILAQWGLETSWRIHTFTGYNWGNCGAMPNEPAIPGTSAPGSPAAFSYAYTPTQGVDEYVHVAHLRYYAQIAIAARVGGADAAARALGSSPWDWGHYTNYNSPGSSLIGLMRAYNLYWYDHN
ncbi:MAG TPA: LysM peptidoglycan-binding domain-containing protein [Ktedonobacterales bacterium]